MNVLNQVDAAGDGAEAEGVARRKGEALSRGRLALAAPRLARPNAAAATPAAAAVASAAFVATGHSAGGLGERPSSSTSSRCSK